MGDRSETIDFNGKRVSVPSNSLGEKFALTNEQLDEFLFKITLGSKSTNDNLNGLFRMKDLGSREGFHFDDITLYDLPESQIDEILQRLAASLLGPYGKEKNFLELVDNCDALYHFFNPITGELETHVRKSSSEDSYFVHIKRMFIRDLAFGVRDLVYFEEEGLHDFCEEYIAFYNRLWKRHPHERGKISIPLPMDPVSKLGGLVDDGIVLRSTMESSALFTRNMERDCESGLWVENKDLDTEGGRENLYRLAFPHGEVIERYGLEFRNVPFRRTAIKLGDARDNGDFLTRSLSNPLEKKLRMFRQLQSLIIGFQYQMVFPFHNGNKASEMGYPKEYTVENYHSKFARRVLNSAKGRLKFMERAIFSHIDERGVGDFNGGEFDFSRYRSENFRRSVLEKDRRYGNVMIH